MGKISIKTETIILDSLDDRGKVEILSKLDNRAIYRFEEKETGNFQYGIVSKEYLWGIGFENELPPIVDDHFKNKTNKEIDSSTSHFTEDFVLKLAKALK